MLLAHARLASFATPDRYGLIDDAGIAIEGDEIAWAGPMADLPDAYRKGENRDLEGRLVTPGLIDCHTHLVFGGNRAGEFEMRLDGASYEEIARAGGGIVSTVSATRDASEAELVAGALTRIDAMIAEGVTTVEIKSGYGLDIDTELRMLRVARQIADLRPISVRTSFLGAHAVPPEFTGRPDDYLDEVAFPALRAAHEAGLIDAVDGFCEGIAFDIAQMARVFDLACDLRLPVKLHAEQLSHMGGTALAAKYGALSADHVEYANDADARALASADSVAVLLPGAFYTLHETQLPPVQAFRDAGVSMALATDCNPGSSPLASLLLTLNMGCTLFQLSPEEALAGATCHAAKALDFADRGRIAAGQRADICIWDVDSPAELPYRIGFNPLHTRIFGGQS